MSGMSLSILSFPFSALKCGSRQGGSLTPAPSPWKLSKGPFFLALLVSLLNFLLALPPKPFAALRCLWPHHLLLLLLLSHLLHFGAPPHSIAPHPPPPPPPPPHPPHPLPPPTICYTLCHLFEKYAEKNCTLVYYFIEFFEQFSKNW